MTKPAPPSTSAGAGAQRAVSVDVPGDQPAAPVRADVAGALLAGLPTLVFAGIIACAVAMSFAGSFVPRPHIAATIAFVLIPGVGLAVFVRRWVLTLRGLVHGAEDEVRWPFLLVPFFVVLGVAAGVGFAYAVVLGIDPTGEVAVRRRCDALVATPGAVQEDRCQQVGGACARSLLASGEDTLDALHACMDAELAPPAAR